MGRGTAAWLPGPAPVFPREESQLVLAQGCSYLLGTWQLLLGLGAVTTSLWPVQFVSTQASIGLHCQVQGPQL